MHTDDQLFDCMLLLLLLLLLHAVFCYSVRSFACGRRVCLALEHDRMHLETLMYMAVQQVRRGRRIQHCMHELGKCSWPFALRQAPLPCALSPFQDSSLPKWVVLGLQVKADFLAGPERPATPRGSQSAKEAASGGKVASCNTVSVPGAGPMQPRLRVHQG